MAKENHIFISHASEDDAKAEKVSRWLKKAGLKGWLDQTDILPARDWRGAIHSGIESAAALVVLISASSRASRWVREECRLARKNGVPVVPALIGRDRKLLPGMSDLQYVDLRKEDSPGWRKLLTALRTENLQEAGPIIHICFEIDPWGDPNRTLDGKAYDILMSTENAPFGTSLVKYELLDPSYDNPIRQSSRKKDNFEAWTTAWGDVPVVAQGFGRRNKRRPLWTARATFGQALRRTYKNVKQPSVRRAVKTIGAN